MSDVRPCNSSTASKGVDQCSHSDQENTQHDLSTDESSLQTFAQSDMSSNVTDLESVSQKSNEHGKIIESRWDDCLKKTLQEQPIKNQLNQKQPVHAALDQILVREFLPQMDHDPILPVLREIFVRSFDHFYKEIEAQLGLKTSKTLVEWLQETFDDMQEEMLTKSCRCFMLCSSGTVENNSQQSILGFLTVKEEANGSIYISQCAIAAENKRRGYGARLLQHLRTIYPPGTSYWGLCRRANIPAVKFYLKHGAKFIDNEEVATKYAYDPKLYTGFQFTDNIENSQLSESRSSTIPSVSPTEKRTPEILQDRRPHVTHQDDSTMTDPLLDIQKLKKRKKNKCCVIS